jgi:hypothetical protein
MMRMIHVQVQPERAKRLDVLQRNLLFEGLLRTRRWFVISSLRKAMTVAIT